MEALDFKIKEITKSYLDKLQTMEKFDGDILHSIPPIIKLLEEMFNRLRTFIVDYTFENENEEIRFFKEIKPQLFSKLIYYQTIYRIEAMRPNGSDEVQEKYIEKELDRLKDYFDQNLDFYQYYRTKCSHLDKLFFTRGESLSYPNLESFYYERDPNFSSHCDFKVTSILANDLLRIYLKADILKLKEHDSHVKEIQFPKIKETWTRSKVDLVELIYAICETNCFNHGKISLKRLADYFGNVFNVDLGNPYHTYVEIRDRNQRTSFLDELKANLTAKMDGDDNK